MGVCFQTLCNKCSSNIGGITHILQVLHERMCVRDEYVGSARVDLLSLQLFGALGNNASSSPPAFSLHYGMASL
jgi:hypothetical protein